MTFCKARLEDFVTACGSQRAAAAAIDVSESMLSLILADKRSLLPEHAARIERENPIFRAEELLPNVTFVRGASGQVIAYQTPLESAA